MFGRKQTQQFEITEHPEVIAALNAMWQQAYEAGRRDALAIATDLLEECQADPDAVDGGHDYTNGIAGVIARLEV